MLEDMVSFGLYLLATLTVTAAITAPIWAPGGEGK